jgi:outer membrane protein TolC
MIHLLWPLLAWSQEIRSENIKSLLEARNPRVSAANLSSEAAAKREGAFVRSFLPSVEAYAAQEKFKKGRGPAKDQPAYGVEASINLFNGGKDWLNGRSVSLEAEKKKSGGQRVLSEELEKARSAYWELRYLQEKSSLLKSTLEVNQKNLDSALRRIRSGVATKSDQFEFEMKEVELRREQAETALKIATGEKALALLLGLGDAKLSFPESLAHDHAYEEVLKHSPEDHSFLFREAEIEAEQADIASSSRGRDWWPKLDAYAAFNQYNEREEDFANKADRKESVVGLRLSLSLSAGAESVFESAALAKETEAAKALGEFQRDEIKNHIDAEIASLKLLHDQVHEAEENIRRASGYYNITQSEYARGVKNSPDVLGAADKLYDMQHKRLEIIRDFQVAKGHILAKIGR